MVIAPSVLPVILTGIDFSEGSAAALRQARTIADRGGGTLAAVHVQEYAATEEGETQTNGRVWAASRGVPLDDYQSRKGVPWAELVRLAESLKASTIVLGSHGKSGYQPLALGSTVTRVVLLAPCPVLIVRPDAADALPRLGRTRP